MATNNVNNKVTFWNNVSFTPEDVKNNFILNDKPGLDNKGIYFNSNSNYPHIIYNGYIYTTGSYVSSYDMVDSSEIVNAITSITADPFTKTISYQYTQINIGDIINRIVKLEKQASIIDTPDTITLKNNDGSPFTGDKIELLIGQSKTIIYSTKSGLLSKAESTSTSIASLTRNEENATITITAASKLTAGDDSTKKSQIVLTSYDGIIGDYAYTSTSSIIYAYVNKKPQEISYGTSFTGNLTVGTSAQLTIQGAETDIIATPSSTSIIEVNVDVSEKNKINIKPIKQGNATITVYAISSDEYKKSNTKTINVAVSAQQISPSTINLIPSTLSLSGNDATATLTYTFEPDGVNTNTAVTFTSDNENVAKVNKTSGEVTTKGVGTTTINASTPNGIKASCTITVSDGSVQSVSVDPTKKPFSSAGGTVPITATVTHNCFTDPNISWSASDTTKGSFNTTSGTTVQYTANKNENTNAAVNVTITATATCSNNSKSATCSVTVEKKPIEIKYYWYVGQTDPASNTTITSTVGAEGWRLIDNPNTVSQSNPLFDTTTTSDDRIVGTSKTYWFIALPADKSYKIYDSDYADQIAAGNFEKQSSTVSFKNVNYTVYKGVGTARNFDGYTIY